VFAMLLFALIVAVVTQQVLAYVNDPYSQRMTEVAKFCRFHHVPRGLHEKASAYFEMLYARTPLAKDRDFLAQMTPTLQRQMWDHLLSTTIHQIKILAKVAHGAGGGKLGRMFGDPRLFHIGVYQRLNYMTYAPHETILSAHEGAHEEALRFLRRGEAHAITARGQRAYSLFQVGDVFGERCLLDPPQPEATEFRARTRCDVLSLSKAALLAVVAEHLVPAHRAKLTTDLYAEMARKAELLVAALRNAAADEMAEGRDETERALEEAETQLETLKAGEATEALASIIDAGEDS